ncbi:polynucleotide 5'-hydroxyl-kinase NOL9 [Ochlerotatus camptorhynchus]|uniref:polynucleotide 5'-hydroxyl-kinase NOL9 n=1 Tax=Ochlerotatus camptorhynchus TaxID=644619 RepID=UPI0031DE3DD2
MNKSKQDTLSRNHSFSGKQKKIGGKKPGKPWKKQFSTSEETLTEKAKTKLLPAEDLRYTEMANGFADMKNLKKSNQQKLFGQKEKTSSAQKSPQRTTRKEVQTKVGKEKKTDRHSLKSVENRKATKKQTPPEPTKADRQQKRKKSQIDAVETKAKKKKRSQSESDSDADDYMDRFFQDVSDGDPEEDPTAPDLYGLPPIGGEEEEGSDLNESESTGGDNEQENDENGMSLEELVDFYGKHQDRATDGGKAGKQKKTAGKAGKVERKSKSSQGNDWIEEDNDVDLVYDDSDGEKEAGCKMLVPAGNGRIEKSDDEQESASSEESGEEEEDENGWMSLEHEGSDSQEAADSDDDSATSDSDYSESEVDDDESELEDDEFSSDYDSDDSDDLDDSDDEYPSYWDESYDSDEDEDYIAGDEDDLYISRGAAQIYEITDNQVSFNSDVESAQIVELPCDDVRKRSCIFSVIESQEPHDDKVGCPELVPIYDAEGNLIDSLEKLNRSKILETNASQKPSLLNQSSPVPSSAERELMEEDTPLPTRNLKDLAKQDDAMDEDVDQNADADSNYRIYDSIDMRMSLLVLKETLYFSGHLTIQPLVGGLEVMGYYLRPGECRSVYAVRGFHSLNLSPHAEATPSSMETIRKVMTRVEKHFQVLDLQEIQENFDPAVSVLVLLQANCNNKKITVVDKYLSEDLLFPRVEFLKKSVLFTTEYLLNVEFYTEHVDKSTSLYRSDPEWDKIDVKNNSKIVVMGGKGSGKSTLCQYLVNRNVAKFRKVILIDLDIGQPIQHIPETISVTIVDRPLLGVATFSPIKPVKSWLFGSLNIVSSLIFYIQNVRQLLRYCEQHKSELANVPWIINTMGYVTDFGEELMAVILRMFSPTDVIQLVSTNKLLAIPNYQNRLTCEFINQFSFNILRSEVQEYIQRKATFKHYELNVCYPKKGFTLNAPKRRFLMLLAHLADILNDTSSEWFNDVKPFCAPLSQLQVLVTREDQTLADEQLPSVLNATLVYLCQKVDGGLYECLGIGIVRGVDKNNNVYLLQSLPAERLADVNVLAICSSSLPNAVFLRQSAKIQGSIPYVYNID